jgi:hypothetical protein
MSNPFACRGQSLRAAARLQFLTENYVCGDSMVRNAPDKRDANVQKGPIPGIASAAIRRKFFRKIR